MQGLQKVVGRIETLAAQGHEAAATTSTPASMRTSDEDNEDNVAAVANVAMTPFSVIAATCLQVTLSSNAPDEKSLTFNLVIASIIATAGMLMAVYLVTCTSCKSRKPPAPPEQNKFLTFMKKIFLPDQPELYQMDEKERIRIARMMLRCLWFSLSYMVTGLLGSVLRHQLKISTWGTVLVAVTIWLIFIWSGFGAPLPKFGDCLRKTGSIFTTAFPLVLIACYTGIYFTENIIGKH